MRPPDEPAEIKLLPTPTSHERTHTPRPVDHGAQLANELWALQRSDPSSVGPGSSTLGCTSPASSTRGCAKPTRGDATCSAPGSPESRCTTMCGPSEVKLLPTPNAAMANYEEDPASWRIRQATLKAKGINGNGAGVPLAIAVRELAASTSSPVAFRARAPAAPGSATGSSTPKPLCGSRCDASFANFDPAMCSSRTWGTSAGWLLPQASLLDPCGEPFSGTWPRSGSVTSDGTAYPLAPSAPRTSVTGSSAWLPVPTQIPRREPLSPQYAAGLLDGEGCISMAKHHRGKTSVVRVAIHMATPGKAALEAMLATYGGHLSLHRKETKDWRATWQWAITGRDDVMRCLSDVLPHLIVKAPQARLAISWLTLLTDSPRKTNGNVDWTPAIVETAARVCGEMTRLNRRGPAQSSTIDAGLMTLLPSPLARTKGGTQVSGDNRTGGPMLQEAVIGLLPTPKASDDKLRRSPADALRKDPAIETVVWNLPRSLSTGASTAPPSTDGKPSTGLRLNPSFVEWMMGTPVCGECGLGWTDPDCPHSVTQFTSTAPGPSG